jgi:hypothetical protein
VTGRPATPGRPRRDPVRGPPRNVRRPGVAARLSAAHLRHFGPDARSPTRLSAPGRAVPAPRHVARRRGSAVRCPPPALRPGRRIARRGPARLSAPRRDRRCAALPRHHVIRRRGRPLRAALCRGRPIAPSHGPALRVGCPRLRHVRHFGPGPSRDVVRPSGPALRATRDSPGAKPSRPRHITRSGVSARPSTPRDPAPALRRAVPAQCPAATPSSPAARPSARVRYAGRTSSSARRRSSTSALRVGSAGLACHLAIAARASRWAVSRPRSAGSSSTRV